MIKKVNLIVLFVYLSSILSGCGHAPIRELPPPSPFANNDQKSVSNLNLVDVEDSKKVRPGLLVKLKCSQEETLNGSFRVSFENELRLPFGIRLETSDINREDLKRKIVQSLQKFYTTLPDLQISFDLDQVFIDVRGPLIKPGKILIKKQTSIDEILSLAGGFIKDQNASTVKVVRGEGIEEFIDLEGYFNGKNIDTRFSKWVGGEIIVFSREKLQMSQDQIRVMGSIAKAGEYTFKNGSDLYDYLSQAGGPTQDADLTKVELLRGIPGQRNAQFFDLTDPTQVPKVYQGDLFLFHPHRQSNLITYLSAGGSMAAIITALVFVFRPVSK